MRLVVQRAWAARGLLTAAAAATLIVTVLLTGLAEYGRGVADAGTRSAIAASSADERSILVRGSAGGSAQRLAERDAALRSAFADGLGGQPARVSAAGYAAGRQLTGDTGSAVPDADGLVFGSVVFLDGLDERAELTAGAWPRPGARAVQVTLAEPAAAALGVTVGDRIPITDRITGRTDPVTVVGLWRPRDLADTYWRLVPEVAEGTAPRSATYGPIAVHRDDFAAHFAANASAAWLVEPELTGATQPELARVGKAAAALAGTLAEAVGLGDSGLVSTRIDEFAARLARADLVGRSALVTPLLLVLVLGGYTLLLVAMLLTEHRRGETALLRARGAARNQVAALVAREAALVVLPALALAPLLATALLRYAERTPALAAATLRLHPGIEPATWLAAALAAAGCAAAMLVPALRRGDSYVSDLAAQSRPNRRANVQRAGVDLALVALAVLGWSQLRQYASPLTGSDGNQLGIDPLLAATPTLGVLAGAVLALRLLPPLSSLAQRYVDRRPWTATMLGLWQAGRRPHAGPVLLLALSVAISALAWCLAGTSARSLDDQANHQVGADLRLVETDNVPPVDRAGQLAALPGVTAVMPAWRENLRLGPTAEPASLLAVDAGSGADVIRLRGDLAGGHPDRVFHDLAGAQGAAPLTSLPPDARTLQGELRTTIAHAPVIAGVRNDAVLATADGAYLRLPLGTSRGDGTRLRFSVALPDVPQPLQLAGFVVSTTGANETRIQWRLTGLRTGGAAGSTETTPLDLASGGAWRSVDQDALTNPAMVEKGSMSVDYVYRSTHQYYERGIGVQLALVRRTEPQRLAVTATPQALAALRLAVGDETRLSVGPAEVEVRIAGTVTALPGGTEAAAFLVDLPSLSATLFHERGLLPPVREWWVTTEPGRAPEAATAAAGLTGLTVLDRQVVAESLARDPYGSGARAALFAAALGALLLAAVGVAVDVRATARRRAGELAVLRTLGAGPRLLARALIAEQSFLAGIGVLVGLAVGVAVAAVMAPLVILTPTADRPSPAPVLVIDWLPLLATAGGLLVLALLLSALIATGVRHRIASRLRSGEER